MQLYTVSIDAFTQPYTVQLYTVSLDAFTQPSSSTLFSKHVLSGVDHECWDTRWVLDVPALEAFQGQVA